MISIKKFTHLKISTGSIDCATLYGKWVNLLVIELLLYRVKLIMITNKT